MTRPVRIWQRRPLRRALRNWLERHQNPVNFWIHLVGIPLALGGIVLFFVLPWEQWYWPAPRWSAAMGYNSSATAWKVTTWGNGPPSSGFWGFPMWRLRRRLAATRSRARSHRRAPLRVAAKQTPLRLPALAAIGLLVEQHDAHPLRARFDVGGKRPRLDAATRQGADDIDGPGGVAANALAGQLIERDRRLDLPGVGVAVDSDEPLRIPSQIAPAVVAHAAPLIHLQVKIRGVIPDRDPAEC